jgi:hypothetical protein
MGSLILAQGWSVSDNPESEIKTKPTTGFAPRVLNPTHGSGWIGSGPFYTPVPEAPSNPTHGSGWILQLLRPKDLKHPPTAVGGIPIALWVFI